jgi:hypothetical protein
MPLTNVFRTDGWVKSSLGPAVPGAQVYVCLQPANLASLPPSPLANIFSDPRGLVPITQPIITDGFGHYDFYAANGVYTLVVGLSGLIQQVYPDQSVGGASGTNGTTPGTALVLQSNGVANGNQLLFNLHSADGTVVITDDGIGDINLKANTSTFNTSGQGWMIGPGMTDAQSLVGQFNAAITNFSANQVIVMQFVLQSSWTVSKCAYQVSNIASGNFNIGIYDSGSNKKIDALFDGSTSALQTISFSPTTLPPGVYYFACSATTVSITGPALQASPSIYTQLLKMLNAGSSPVVASAANATVSNVLPATLGTLTPITTSVNWQSVPICVWLV